MFTADITALDGSSAMQISYNGTSYPVKVNKNGALADIYAHNPSGTYKYLQAYTVIDFVFDGTNLIIVGNPVVISSTDYTIYADGRIGNDEVGTIKGKSTNEIPYGWLECNGQSVLRSAYPTLFEKFNTQTYDGTNTLLSRYGSADSTHFNLPDYREVALVGIGTNGTDSIANHDSFTLGQFKDDQLQDHTHGITITTWAEGGAGGPNISQGNISGNQEYNTCLIKFGRKGDVTRTKEKGIIYLIKVL
jgi:microcystin-dependent protein